MNISKYIGKIISVVIIVCVMCAVWFFGGNYVKNSKNIPLDNSILSNNTNQIGETSVVSSDKDKYQTDPIPEGNPLAIEPQDVESSDTEYTCTLSVRCDTILNNMKYLSEEKYELIPDDGIIFPETEVVFYDGESVFNVLQREMKRAKIHMEFMNTPLYNSAYIEGINNIYECDAGELSGWMYKVNGWFPNYGCSRYQLKDGDVVEWVYTCDYGADVGNEINGQVGIT